jgi:hypothetical protein
MNKLSKGFEFQKKEAFLKASNIEEGSKENYIFSLNTIMNYEGKHKKCIFYFDDREIKEFIIQIKPGTIRKIKSIVSEYYDYYKKEIDSTVSDGICISLKDNNLIEELYRNYMEIYFLSMKELIDTLTLIKANKREVGIAVLLFMGIEPKIITDLQVKHVEIETRQIKFSNITYSNINESIFNLIVSVIENVNDNEEYIIKPIKNTGENKIGSINGILTKLNAEANSFGINKTFNSIPLRDAGSLSYYCSHKEIFNIADNDIEKLKLFKLFGMIRKVSPARMIICKTDLKFQLNIIESKIKDTEKIFNANIVLTQQEIKNMKIQSNSEYENLLDEMKKLHPEKERTEDDEQEKRHAENKEKGNKSEKTVKDILESKNFIRDVKLMKDYTGYDIQFKIAAEEHRVEVKTIGERLEFYITINELNNLFDNRRKNYVIALVQDESVFIIENIVETLKLEGEFIYRYLNNEKVQVVSETFKIRLNKKTFKKLKSISDYINVLKSKYA